MSELSTGPALSSPNEGNGTALGSSPAAVADVLAAIAGAAHAASGLEPDAAASLAALHRLHDVWGGVGPVTLAVDPFEIRLGSESVYAERDPERSLAYRLFREGVRRLTLRPDPGRTEALAFVETLAASHPATGILGEGLRGRARAARLRSVSLLGRGEVEEPPPPPSPGMAACYRAARSLGEPVPVAWAETAEDERTRLHADESLDTLRADAVRALIEWVPLAAADGPVTFDDAGLLIERVKGALLDEGPPALDQVASLVRALHQAARRDPRVLPLLETFSRRPTLEALAAAGPAEEPWPSLELLGLLDLLPSAPLLDSLLDWMYQEADAARRKNVGRLIEALAHSQPDIVIRRLREAPPPLVWELLRLCARAIPERVAEGALGFAFDGDEAMVLEALAALGEAPPTPDLARGLLRRLDSPSAEIRLRVLDILARRPEHSAFAPLARYVERRIRRGLNRRETDEYGRGLARLSPEAAVWLFKGWASSPITEETRLLSWTAASGLVQLDGDESKAVLAALRSAGDDELKAHIDALSSRGTNEASRE